ncbi:MAG TPA: efflux RND transporter periplasmic adaptor subunit [Casimicrobium sp.]|nr:efflux RND transporter periplasmic adaptor subunit [Casimicrobium sp.]
MMNKKILLLALTLAATASVATLSGCGKKDDASTESTKEPNAAAKAEAPRPVRVMQAGMSTISDISYLPGEVRPRYEQRYGFRVPGKIARRMVDVGQVVKAGQVLAVLDSQDVLPAINAQAAQVDVAKTDWVLQQSELKRQQELRDKGFVSGAALERQAATTAAADARVKAAQSQLANAKNGLTFQTLTADKAGVVVAVDAEAGSVVAAGQSVVRVAQLGEKELVVNVPERAVGQMKQAKGFMAQFDAIPGKTYAATLRELAPAADAASRTYAAKLSISNADDALKLGMSATVRLDLGAAQVIVVPNTALYTRDNAPRVWLVDRATETVRAVEVKLGESTNEGVTIASGLKSGDLVVTAGANLLQAGQKVRLIDVPAAAPAVPAAIGPGSAPTTAPAKPASAAVVPASAKP